MKSIQARPSGHEATAAKVQGDQRLGSDRFYCRHCGLYRPMPDFIAHLGIAEHVDLFADTLQHARVIGREANSGNVLTARLFSGNEPRPDVARMHVALARRGEWP